MEKKIFYVLIYNSIIGTLILILFFLLYLKLYSPLSTISSITDNFDKNKNISGAVSSNRDGLVADLNNLGAMAQQFYRKPTSFGGGGNDFTGWKIPARTEITPNGSYIASVTSQRVTIRGTGTEMNEGRPIVHEAVITPTTISIKRIN
jgi:hypothetical protein